MNFMRFRRTLLPFLVATTLLTACGAGTDNAATPSGQEVTSTSTTIDVRSRDVPEHPDAAYVAAVMKELEHVRGDIRRDVYSTQSYSQADEDRINDIFGPDVAKIEMRTWQSASMKAHDDALSIPGDEKIENIVIFDSRKDCVVFSGDDNNSALLKTPNTTAKPKYIFQISAYDSNNGTNPTPWKITVESTYDDSQKSSYRCDE